MNENPRFSGMLVISVGIIMMLSTIGTLPLMVGDSQNEISIDVDSTNVDLVADNKLPNERGTRAGSPRTVLAELFTNWGCTPCTYANPPMNDLLDVYNSSELIMIAYHTWWPSGSDPFYLHNAGDSFDRTNYYGVQFIGVPSIYFDGPPRYGHNGATTYDYYKGFIETELAILSPVEITLEGFIFGTSGQVNITIEATDTLPVGNLQVKYAIVEDNNYAAGPNGEVRHRYAMRDMLNPHGIPDLDVGESYSTSRIFEVNAEWDVDRVSIVAFLQNDDDGDVLQAASYDFIPQKILVVDDDASGHPDGEEDFYHEILTEMQESWDGWALDERGYPTAQDLIPYDVVIWETADQSSMTLSSENQDAISTYLDTTTGSLFLVGENIGADIGSSTFFSDYLHAEFGTDDTNDNQVTGVEDDPISGPFFGTSIGISWISPSEIKPFGTATTIFRYSTSGKSGGIRAGHDPNSRIVYFGFSYFEGSDSNTNKMTIMERVLDWINIDIDYILIRDSPGGTGDEITDVTINVGNNITLYAAGYNNKLGFVEDLTFTVWMEDSGGSVITVTSPGDSSIITASMDGGLAIATADYLGLPDTVDISVPTVDYLRLTHTPGGVELQTVKMGASEQVKAYASGYNITTGYVKLVDVDWSESTGLGTLSDLTGTSTTFTSGLVGGDTTITGMSISFGSDSFFVNISTAVVDYIEIRDAPDGGGSVITSIDLDAGESILIWAAAYNDTAGYLGDYVSTTWIETSSGSVISVSTPGDFTTVTAQLIGGSSTLTADYNGTQDSIPLTVNPPTTDYVQIMDAPAGGGTDLSNPANYPSYPVGQTITFYGAMYNVTAGFIGDVAASSSWSSGNANLITVTSPGSTSTVTCSDTKNGLAVISLFAPGHTTSTTVTIFPPTIDIVKIRDSPNGEGDSVSTPIYDVGEEDTFIAAGYNITAGFLEDVIVTWGTTDFTVCDITSQNESVHLSAIGIGTCNISADWNGMIFVEVEITVEDITPPYADAGLGATIDEDTVHNFDASGSFDNSEIEVYYWDFGDGVEEYNSIPLTTHTYDDPGTYTVMLGIIDSGGNTAQDEIIIVVLDVTPPQSVINIPDYSEEKAPFLLDGSGSSDNVGIVSYEWVLGDGSTYFGEYDTVSHIFETPGTYTVNLTVEDAAGNQHTTSSSINVKDLTPPSAPKGLEVKQVAEGEALTLTWNPVSDSDLDHYDLYVIYGTGNESKLGNVSAGTTTFTHENLQNGQIYRYYLKAVDTSNNPSIKSLTVEGMPDIDSDSDGIYDLADYDDDDDGLSDEREEDLDTDPLNPDSDGDSHVDGEDEFPLNEKEWIDADGDGYGDKNEDAFPDDAGEWEDSDEDGIGDNSDFLSQLPNLFFWLIIILVVIVTIVGAGAIVRHNRKVALQSAAVSQAAAIKAPQAEVAPPAAPEAEPITFEAEEEESPEPHLQQNQSPKRRFQKRNRSLQRKNFLHHRKRRNRIRV
jgi:PKD repeat protein